MSWIIEHKRFWRTAVGMLLYASMIILSLSINPLKLWGLLLFIVAAACASILETIVFKTAAADSFRATGAQQETAATNTNLFLLARS